VRLRILSNIGFLKDAAELVHSHHEKYDGTGYPRGLQRDNIPFGARVFAIVDTVDAMIYKRPTTCRFPSAKRLRKSGGAREPNSIPAWWKQHLPISTITSRRS